MLTRVVNNGFTRPFAATVAKVMPSIQSLNEKFTIDALDMYKKNKIDVDKELDKVCSLIPLP